MDVFRLNAHEFGWILGVGDGQGGLVCCDSWGRKELDITEWLNWTELNWTEAEDIKKKWQEYTEELYKKDLHDPDNHDGVITQLEPDILECEVKRAFEKIITNKLVEVKEFQLNYFKSWKMMPWKCCTQYASKLENSAVATGLEKVRFHSNSKERQCQRMIKLPHNCTHLTC